MGTKFWCGIGVLASIAAATGTASAADLAVKAPPRVAAAPVYMSEWAGFYIGVHGGYGWSDTSFDAPNAILNEKLKGGVFGGQAGYNWQYGSVVGGLEVDFSGADIKQTVLGVEEKVNELASARGRLGYALFPGILAYGTAGIGWGHFNASNAVGDSVNANDFGWVAGAGLEYKLMEHLLLRAEYLHYDFAKNDLNGADKVNVVRAGVSYKF